MVDGDNFSISYQRLVFLSVFSRRQLIQNSAPSTIVWNEAKIALIAKSPLNLQGQKRLFSKSIFGVKKHVNKKLVHVLWYDILGHY